MKNLLKVCLVVSVLFFFSISANAQKALKFGHLDFAELYSSMPAQDSVKQIYNDYAQSLKTTLEQMQNELQNKYADYQSNIATMSDIIKQTKEKEMQDLQNRMKEFNAQAQKDLQAKEAELTNPLIEKAQNAVKEVAKENGYSYIFNSTGGLLLYAQPSDDIMPLVKKKLGIK